MQKCIYFSRNNISKQTLIWINTTINIIDKYNKINKQLFCLLCNDCIYLIYSDILPQSLRQISGARPEICLPPKNIHIPAQEGRPRSSVAWGEGQRAAGVKSRKEERLRQQRGDKKDSCRFLVRLPAARFWSVCLAPRSLGPVEQSARRLPCNWASPFHTENGMGTLPRRQARLPRRSVDFCFHLKASQF